MRILAVLFIGLILIGCSSESEPPRETLLFTRDWKFYLGDTTNAFLPEFDDSDWRILDLPHDWSIEGMFSEEHPGGSQGGFLPTGTGWYRKSFRLPESGENKHWYIDFDGVYRNSVVWINGHFLGNRASGYSSFRYELTPWLLKGVEDNIIAVRVDNSQQPNSRWYTGSGIYRNVWLTASEKVHIDHWGSFVRTISVDEKNARLELDLEIRNHSTDTPEAEIQTEIYDSGGNSISSTTNTLILGDTVLSLTQLIDIPDPLLWSPDNPAMYSAMTRIFQNGKETDRYETPFGIKYIEFHPRKGFFLNGESLKIKGVNQHHDLGALGAAVNTRAMERQLEILKRMGCNAIRTAHNLPAPELLDLADRMGFLVMDECFDVWARRKVRMDAHLDWKEWHIQDLQDMVKRDRNHPSVFMWSIGNEIPEQFDSSGTRIARELADAIRELDSTRLITCALTEQDPELNYIYQSGTLDVISFNYKHKGYMDFPSLYPGEALLASENVSAISTRGQYNMPSDSIRIWPLAYNIPLEGANPDLTGSAYDNAHAYWGATHEETWDVVKKNDFISGLFIWSGFDYLGEPTPYPWPARSSYLGVIDLAGFPKDAYYLYQSEWTEEDVLHVFPHWNWEKGQEVDVWAYYNKADEAELFLNGKSMGSRMKGEGEYHVMWRLPYEPGSIRVVKKQEGKVIQEKEIHTAGDPAKIELLPDRSSLSADGTDLSFITVRILDREGNFCPLAMNQVRFKVTGRGSIAGVDNGYQASLESFKSNTRKAFNGMCLLIVQADREKGDIQIEAVSEGLEKAEITLITN